jgi:hypothetical protein
MARGKFVGYLRVSTEKQGKSGLGLEAHRNRFIAETNDKPKPFVWTKSVDAILAAVNRGRQALDAIH